MVTMKEKDFIRLFLIELILVQKDSVFDLWDDETIVLPNNYLNLLEKITSDEIKKVKYQNLIPSEQKDKWKVEIKKELNDFLKTPGVNFNKNAQDLIINLNREAISLILFNKEYDYSQRGQMAHLVENFLRVKNKTKPKQKSLV